MQMPRTSARVVCTLRETIDTLVPTRLFSSVDLPAFGTPISATKPARASAGVPGAARGGCLPRATAPEASSGRARSSLPPSAPPSGRARDALPLQHGPGGRLLGEPLRGPLAEPGRETLDPDGDAEPRRVVGAGALHHP